MRSWQKAAIARSRESYRSGDYRPSYEVRVWQRPSGQWAWSCSQVHQERVYTFQSGASRHRSNAWLAAARYMACHLHRSREVSASGIADKHRARLTGAPDPFHPERGWESV